GMPLLRGGIRGMLNSERKADINAQTVQRLEPADPTAKRLAAPAKAKVGGRQEGQIMPIVEAINRAHGAGKAELSLDLKKNYIKAREMQKEGRTKLEISQETGLHPVPMDNGKEELFWEITGQTKPKKESDGYWDTTEDYGAVPEVFENDLMFELMPELKKMKVEFDPDLHIGSGSFNRDQVQGSGMLHIGSRQFSDMSDAQMESMQDDMFDTGIHELSHGGSKALGLPQGGNPSMFRSGYFSPDGDFSGSLPQSDIKNITERLR
ncbi:unnamed protein product, partial [marine sediment metagenome]